MKKIVCILLISLLSVSLFAFGAQYVNAGVVTQESSSSYGLIELMTEYDVPVQKDFKCGGLVIVDVLFGDKFDVITGVGPFIKLDFSDNSELLAGITFGIDWEDIKNSTINFRFQDEFNIKKNWKALIGCEIGSRFSKETSITKVFAGVVYSF